MTVLSRAGCDSAVACDATSRTVIPLVAKLQHFACDAEAASMCCSCSHCLFLLLIISGFGPLGVACEVRVRHTHLVCNCHGGQRLCRFGADTAKASRALSWAELVAGFRLGLRLARFRLAEFQLELERLAEFWFWLERL